MPGYGGSTGSNVPGGPVTRSEWATSLLLALGNSAPSNQTRQFVEAWTQQEGGGFTNNCRYNLLNTMQTAPGSTQCSGTIKGIQSYSDVNSSIQANAQAIQNGYYPNLLHALRYNDTQALAASNGVAKDLTTWVQGPNYSGIDTSYVNSIRKLAGNPGTSGGDVTSSSGSSKPTTPPSFDFGSFWTNTILPFFEHAFLLVLALVFIVLGFFIVAEKPIKDVVKHVPLI